MIVGITGNSGAGKSTVSKILAKKINAEIIEADEVVKQLSNPGNKYYNEIVHLFGNEVLTNNQLDKKQIAEIIYSNKGKRELLNKLTYKYVVDEIKRQTKNKNTIIIDAPLLFESGLDEICDFTISVLAENANKIERICKRDNTGLKTAQARLNIQTDEEVYIKKSDFIVENNGKLEEIKLEEICTKIGKN